MCIIQHRKFVHHYTGIMFSFSVYHILYGKFDDYIYTDYNIIYRYSSDESLVNILVLILIFLF